MYRSTLACFCLLIMLAKACVCLLSSRSFDASIHACSRLLEFPRSEDDLRCISIYACLLFLPACLLCLLASAWSGRQRGASMYRSTLACVCCFLSLVARSSSASIHACLLLLVCLLCLLALACVCLRLLALACCYLLACLWKYKTFLHPARNDDAQGLGHENMYVCSLPMHVVSA